ncbi:apolipoprotein N-acyltransferase [Thalassobaculum sp. OXR-137]|uniref:apolipoprotein N-acyltransferase n=1 Tax=Thalassobaculum sp. OXR-137 TaxID=3100173 RepID=UPI002AC8AF79|nr:apolipoprotein N-acyltransferase [Thalassobaculum sp. OXR-137]WPZ35595.1 apolipoprotein N-acyltransferase [Thalassobaculum sp. OXR-137]
MPLVALGAGAATALSLAPLHLLPFALGHAALLAVVADAASVRSAAFRAWLWALGYHIAGLHWIANAMLVNAGEHAWLIPFANLGLPAVLALYAALAGGLARRLFRNGWPLWLGLAALYTVAEWVRGHAFTGFPWNLPSATVDGWVALLQPAALVGSYGLSLLVLVVTMAPALWLDRSVSDRVRTVASGSAAALFLVLAGWGMMREATIPQIAEPGGSVPGVVVRVVQGNVPQRDKWNPLLKPEHLGRYITLSDPGRPADVRAPGLAASADRPTVVAWPETAVAHLIGNAPELMAALARVAPPGGSLVFGAPRVAQVDGQSEVYNSVFALDDRARLDWIFDKAHLVPFGEYVPLRNILPVNPIVQSRRDFTPGPGPRTLEMKGAPPVSLLVCYEAIFPDGAVDPADRPAWLLNATNDAWFGRWSGPYQHLAIARLRSIEQGLPMIRAANTGVSTVIDPAGRIVASIGIGVTGSLDSLLPAAIPVPLFGVFGDIPLILMVVSLLAVSAYGRFRDGRRTPAN